MSAGDGRVREALRAWRETGAPEAEANFLAARMRTGSLAEDQLSLAVYLGHPAALICASAERDSGSQAAARATLPTYGWAYGLKAWGFPVTLRVALLGVQIAKERWPALAELDDRLGALVQATTTWLSDEAALSEDLTWSFVAGDWGEFPWGQWLGRELHNARPIEWREPAPGRNAASLIASLVHRGVAEDEVRGRVRAALVSWALGPEHAGG